MTPTHRSLVALLVLGLAALTPAAFAQTPPPDSAAAAPDSVAAPVVPVRAPRASWLSDRLPLGVGDLITVIVDEQTVATEHVSNIATGNRSSRADLNAGIGTDARVGPNKSFGTGVNSNSRDVGDAGRHAGFTAVITVRVTELSPNGTAKIAGTKKVTIDGRAQDVTLTGTIRTSDVDAHNQVRSDRLADAVLTYKGKKLAPRTGFVGSLLGMLWP
jgi:flagellar L-ring protein precursor FlgH